MEEKENMENMDNMEKKVGETIVSSGKKGSIRGGVIVLAAVLTVFMTVCSCVSRNMGELPSREEKEKFSRLSYYKNGRFENEEMVKFFPKEKRKKRSRLGMFRFLFKSPNAPEWDLPKVHLSPADFSGKKDMFSVRWLGHSSLVFELAGARFMTDPVFGNAAPVPGVVRRYTENPMKISELPELDFVLISHDHYDHLEYDFIRAIRFKKFPIVTALGVGARLRSWGIDASRIKELGWHESVVIGNIKVTAVPSRHFSGRSWADRFQTLWASYVIESLPEKDSGMESKKIFFGADSGYGKQFAAAGKKYGPFDLVCLEIDAWNENWPYNHMFPGEMPPAFRDLKGKLFLPIHWGVFDLAMHKWDHSIGEIVRLAKENNIPCITPLMGEKVDLTGKELPQKEWWKKSGKQ